MVSIADAPEIVYTNDRIIDRLFSYLNEGDIKEIVERSLDPDTTDKGGGLILSAVSRSRLSYSRGAENLHTVTADSISSCRIWSADYRDWVQHGPFNQLADVGS